jgi:hypothetical protein
MVVSPFVRPAIGSLLIVLTSVIIMLIDSGPETSVGGSLKLLSLYRALLLLLALGRYRITSNFLIDKLYAKGYLPPLTK